MKEKLNEIADKIEMASDKSDILVLESMLDELGKLTLGEGQSINTATLYFYAGNVYSAIRRIKEDPYSAAWDDVLLEKEVYSLRLSLSALKSIPFDEDNTDLRFRVSTNLANALNHVGRFSEAIEIWDGVLKQYPRFTMASANKGYALFWYARALYEESDRPLFLRAGYQTIKEALEIGVEDHAKQAMEDHLRHLKSIADWDEIKIDYGVETKNESKQEKNYRDWSLSYNLFLNPLNDLGSIDLARNDVLTFPSVIISSEKCKSATPPEVYGIYNQLKQEFVSARYILYEALQESNDGGVHFSDKQVKLYDMLDYRHSGLWVEKLKMSFLSAYAIFDKIAYLINEYWEMNLPIRQVSFSSVWYENGNKKKGLSPRLSELKNWPFRGLYWLSKDLFYKASNEQPMEPGARILYHVRNHITHKYLKVHDHGLYDTENLRNSVGHELSYPISDFELKEQTMKLLKLVRSALIYVSLAAHQHERTLREGISEDQYAEIQLFEIQDEY